MLIESRQNATFKRLMELRESSGRKEQKLFLIDTPRDQERALIKNIEITSAFFCKDFPFEEKILSEIKKRSVPVIEFSKKIFESLCYRENPSGIILEAKTWGTSLAEVNLKKATLVILAEDIEKPGNLGTLLRTADAIGVDAIIGCNKTVELFNPNTLRASAGAAFSVTYATASLHEALAWIKEKKLKLVATSPAAKKNLWEADLREPLALAIGSEAWGLSEELLKAADETISLPMKGTGDSLNVSVATGAILYEVLRQRSLLG
jgi:TrmH family RNA methyltransferase